MPCSSCFETLGTLRQAVGSSSAGGKTERSCPCASALEGATG